MRIRLVFFPIALLVTGCAGTPPAVDPQTNHLASYISANYAAQDHDIIQAAHFYRQSLKGDPANSELLGLSFFYATASGDIEASSSLAARIGEKSPDFRVAQLLLAIVALKHRDYDVARKDLALSAKDPFTIGVLLIDAWAAAGAGDHAAAEVDMKQLSAQRGAENLVMYHRALLAEYAGKPVDAEAAYRKALIGDTSPRIIEAYGRFLERSGRANDAEALYKGFLQNSAVAPIAQAGLDRIKSGEKPDPMIATPQDGAAEILFGIAAAQTEAVNTEVSILYLRLALYLRPDLALANILLADRLESMQKFAEAVAAYRNIDKGSPYYRMAMVQAGIDEARDQNLDGAIADLKALTIAYPHDSESWMALGDAYRQAQKLDAALDAYNHAVADIPEPTQKNWPLFYARAAAESSLHHWDAAEADLDRSLKLSPNEPEVMNFLGYSWVDQNRKIPEALAMLEKAHTLRPFDGYITDSVGWAYYQLGRYDDAAKMLEKAVLMVPGDPTINDHYGDALWRNGQHRDARFQWDHALTFGAEDSEKKTLEQKLKTGLSDDKPA